jgi:copper chaperone CopZ
MKRYVGIICFLIMINSFARAQFTSVLVAVDGLTCSACSYATQKSILQLDFVADVQMDLNSHVATVTFKPDKKIEIDKIVQKVVDAGFSVGGLTAGFNFKDATVSNDYCMTYEGDTFHFISTKESKMNGISNIKFIGEKYMRKKDFKKWKGQTSGACKPPDNSNSSAKIYFVTPA